ncbi:Periplasmic (NiFeSe) hydrogenase small subunit [Desulfovibrionales bacterium]
MGLNRRNFMKLCTGTVAGLGVSQIVHPEVLEVLAGSLNSSRPPVLWIQGAGCTGCSVSLLNTVKPPIADVLLKIISLEFHPTVMAWEGEPAIEYMYKIADKFQGKFFLAVEGAIPVAAGGKYCVIGEVKHKEITMARAMIDLATKAAVVLAIGTCAAYGGIPAAKGNLTEAKSCKDFLTAKDIKTPIVNIPGCPPHPDWIVGTIAVALEAIKKNGLASGLTAVVELLDADGRPKPFFVKNIHENCSYLKSFEDNKFAKTFTNDKSACRYELGCKGPDTNADCFSRKWNNGINWCVENAVCLGCVEKDFPDGKSPFYGA